MMEEYILPAVIK